MKYVVNFFCRHHPKSMRLRRQRAQILQLRQKRDELRREFDLVNSLLMANPGSWNYDCEYGTLYNKVK